MGTQEARAPRRRGRHASSAHRGESLEQTHRQRNPPSRAWQGPHAPDPAGQRDRLLHLQRAAALPPWQALSLCEVAFQALLGHSKEVEEVPQIGSGDAQARPRKEHNGQESGRGAQGPSPQVRRGLKGVGGPAVQNKPVAVKIHKDSKEPGKPSDCGLWIIEMAARLSTQSERQVPNPLNPKPLNPKP